MANRRITRNSYKRKIILVGIMLFMSIALVSTGFAAWVISTGATQEDNGNVEIGIVEGSELEFVEIKYYSDVYNVQESKYEEQEVNIETFEYRFNPKANDTQGRVRYQGEGNDESLKLKIVGYVKPIEFIKNVTFKMEVPQSVKDAADAGYIVLPECATTTVTLSNLQAGAGDFSDCYKFEYTVEFKWGSVFEGLNPGDYYDSHENGTKVETSAVMTELQKFRATAYGYPYIDEVTGGPKEYTSEE